jgi:serum/glucocorticoid-regulated kinase 2
MKIKRKIRLNLLFAVSISNIGSEFVLHIPIEYDYRFQSSDL